MMIRDGKYPINILYNIPAEDKSIYVTEIGQHNFAPAEKSLHDCEHSIFCIHYITKGKWVLDGRILSPGDGFMHFYPPEPKYFATEKIPGDEHEYVFIKIGGYNAKKLLTSCGFIMKNHAFSNPNGKIIAELIYNTLYSDYSNRNIDLMLMGLLYTIMSYHAPSAILQNSQYFALLNADKNSNPYIEIIQKYINENYTEELTVQGLAKMVHLSPNYLSSLFKQSFGMSLQNYIINFRLFKSKELLTNSSHSISKIASLSGFSDSQHYSQLFKKHIKYTPSEYRRLTRLR